MLVFATPKGASQARGVSQATLIVRKAHAYVLAAYICKTQLQKSVVFISAIRERCETHAYVSFVPLAKSNANIFTILRKKAYYNVVVRTHKRKAYTLHYTINPLKYSKKYFSFILLYISVMIGYVGHVFVLYCNSV